MSCGKVTFGSTKNEAINDTTAQSHHFTKKVLQHFLVDYIPVPRILRQMFRIKIHTKTNSKHFFTAVSAEIWEVLFFHFPVPRGKLQVTLGRNMIHANVVNYIKMKIEYIWLIICYCWSYCTIQTSIHDYRNSYISKPDKIKWCLF